MNIIFIDDEVAILRSFKRILRHLSKQHQIEFVSDSLEAIELFKTKTYQLIVSDMKMPEKDGCYVLSEAQKYSPGALRVILSGYSEQEQSLKASLYAHLFIAKPFESRAIVELIERAEGLQQMGLSEKLLSKLGQLNALPPAPKSYRSLTEALRAEDNSITARDISNLLQQDMVLVSKILQLTNSAFFGIPQPINDLERAVTLLGVEIIKGLILHYELIGKLQDQPEPEPWQKAMYRDSIQTAQLAKETALNSKQSRKIQESAFLAGLLHDIGRLVLVEQAEAESDMDKLFAEQTGIELCELEQQLFGVHHGWVGAYLLKLWGFSDEIVEAVALHHYPLQSEDTCFTPLSAVHVALDELDDSYLERIGY
ncbi:MAG: response regulator [Pseudomonadota bacterium]